jgi:hypothetical protein
MASLNRARPFVAILFCSVLGFSSGCGSGPVAVTDSKDKAERVQEASLSQLGDVLRIRQEESSQPPSAVEDVIRYEKAYPLGCGKVKNGQIILFYGALLQDGDADTILAYEKQVPESGGHALMQDGKTIKKMTADEFKTAKKAGKN